MLRRASALAVLCVALHATTSIAYAQDQGQLRGAVAEAEITDELLGVAPRRVGTTQQTPVEPETGLQPGRYSPLSPGAVTEEPGSRLDDPLEDQRTRQDVFADDILGTPTTPRQRPDMTRQQREQPIGVATPREAALAEAQAEEELVTGTVRAGRIDALDEERNERMAAVNSRQGRVEALSRTPDETPFAPLGIRAGSFIVTPTLETGLGWTSNASSSPNGGSSLFSETALRLEAISDWSLHSARLQADGSYRRSISGEDIDELEGGVSGELRLDLAREFTALTSLGYRVRPESASSPVDLGNVTSQPLRHTFTGSTGIAKDIGKLRLDLKGDVVRALHDDADLEGGGTLSQKDRDYTLATAKLRAGYEISPALRPFAELEFGRRIHDNKVDALGYERSADRYGARVGVELDLGEKLNGEISAGWLSERPDDELLEAIDGLALAAALAWSPVRGTTVEFNGSTEIEGTTEAGSSGSMLYSGSVAVNRQLRANLTGRALAGIDWRDYSGGENDLLMRGEVSLTWWMNRNAGITGRLRHERQESTLPGRDYDASSVFLGMTLQR